MFVRKNLNISAEIYITWQSTEATKFFFQMNENILAHEREKQVRAQKEIKINFFLKFFRLHSYRRKDY